LSSVIVVSCPQRAERILQAGTMSCPRCRGRLRPHGYGRTRTVRGLGADTVTVTPRRARCADCSATQILLPTALTVRRADSTEVIGNALIAKANGAGFRTIATQLDRPRSTVRRWLRRAHESHAQWLYERAVEHAATIDRSC
jgi:transposase-like protein